MRFLSLFCGDEFRFAFFRRARNHSDKHNPEFSPDKLVEPTQRLSKLRTVLAWLLVVGAIVFSVAVAFWWSYPRMPVEQPARTFAGVVASTISSLKFGGFFLGLGLLVYLATLLTDCFGFNYRRPVWKAAKVKLYFVNIVVIVLLALGLGFLGAAFLGPALSLLGLDAALAHLLPVMLMIAGVQIVLLWVLIWAPLERRIIRKRLAALGVSRAELESATLVGLSNPAGGFAKCFSAIEEDVGGLWLTPELLIYRGEGEQFGIAREQLVQMERQVDHRSTSMLGGIAHVILHVSLADGSIRPIRLHTEGQGTMRRKREAMDALAGAIAKWYTERKFAYTARTPKIPRF